MILYACSDLIFSTRIASTASSLGIPTKGLRTVDRLRELMTAESDEDAIPHGLIIDMDLQDTALDLIREARTLNPQLTIIAFGAHVEAERLRQARTAGADPVLPRSTFTQNLSEILKSFGE